MKITKLTYHQRLALGEAIERDGMLPCSALSETTAAWDEDFEVVCAAIHEAKARMRIRRGAIGHPYASIHGVERRIREFNP